MKNISSLMENESFQRWLANQSGPEESDIWDTWLSASLENQELYELAVEAWRVTQFRQSDLPEVNKEWHRLRTRLELVIEPQRSDRRESLSGRSYSARAHRFGWARIGVAALVCTLAVLSVRFLPIFRTDVKNEEQSYQVLTTDFGQRVTVKLPDDTRIILNANSTLKYPAAWQASGTNIFRLEGEAYFEVTPIQDPHNKFVIHTQDGSVSVVGTRFAVYERGSGTRVVVSKGRVDVSAVDTARAAQKTNPNVFLGPGQLLLFKRGNRQLQPNSVAVEPYTTWWQNQLVLVRTPFAQIVQRLEETYGVDVKVTDEHLLQRTLSGSIENQNLVVVTDAIAEALRTNVRREGQVITFGRPGK